MNSYERMWAKLQNEPVDSIPNWDIFMAFGAHHIGVKLHDYYLDYRTLVKANLSLVETFSVDIVQAISDPYREAADFGLDVEFPEDSIPMNRQPLIKEPDDLAKLRMPDPYSGRRMSDRLEAVRRFREEVGGRIPIMGWVEGAIAEANDLRGNTNLLTDLYDRPEWLEELLERCTEVAIAFARAQIEAGADIIGLGDAIASQVAPRMYTRFALPYEQRVFQAIHDMGALGRLHICGDTSRIVPFMAQSGADIIDLDWKVDLVKARSIFGENGPALCGNFDPVVVMYRGTPDMVKKAVADCITQAGQKYFSGAGCEIPDGTPYANLNAQSEVLQSFH